MSPVAWRQLIEVAMAEMRDAVKAIVFAQSLGETCAIAQNAHRLKGIARSFAAPRLAAMAERMEIEAIISTRGLADAAQKLREVADLTLVALAALPERA